MLPSSADVNRQMLRPVGTFQPRLPLLCPQTDAQLLPKVCMSSAPTGIIPRPVCHAVSTDRTDVPLKSTNFTAVTSAVRSETVTDGLSPLASPDVCPSLSGMCLNDVDLRLLQDAMKEECAVLGVGLHAPAAGHVTGSHGMTSVSHRGPETSSAEFDSSLSDWSIIDLPSPPMASSVSVEMMPGQTSVTGLASPSLMHFSSDSACSDSSGPVPGRIDHFPAQKLLPACVPLSQPGSGCVSVSSVLYFTVN